MGPDPEVVAAREQARREIVFCDSRIEFLAYRYAPASVFRDGVVSVAEIRDADPTTAPPELRLSSGETLFVSGLLADDLRRFCARNALPIVERPDLWDALLQPFVDTEFTPEIAAVARARLADHGVSEDEATDIRARVAAAMVAYNFGTGLWDWVHLGLMDLLDALSGPFAGEHRLSEDEFAETYWWAMGIAERSAAR